MFFVSFVLDSLPLSSMNIALTIFWKNSISSAAYPCLSIKCLDHRHYGKALSDTTILASVELPPFILCFRDRSIFDPDTMNIIDTVCAPCIMVTRQMTHQPTAWWHSGCRSLVWAAYIGYLLCIWSPSQALPSHTCPQSWLGYIGKQWTSWCIFWPLTWLMAAMSLYGGMMFPATFLVASDRFQASLEIDDWLSGSWFSMLLLLVNPTEPLLSSLPW